MATMEEYKKFEEKYKKTGYASFFNTKTEEQDNRSPNAKYVPPPYEKPKTNLQHIVSGGKDLVRGAINSINSQHYVPPITPSVTIPGQPNIFDTSKVDMPSIIDRAKQDSNSSYNRGGTYVAQNNSMGKGTQDVIQKRAAEAIAAPLYSGLNAATLGGVGAATKLTAPATHEYLANIQKDNKVLSTIGEFAGYAIPGMGIEKGLMAVGGKALAKVLPNAGRIGNVARGIIKGGVEGGTMGAAIGANQGIENNQGVAGVVGNALNTAKDWGTFGGVLGGIGGALKRIIPTKIPETQQIPLQLPAPKLGLPEPQNVIYGNASEIIKPQGQVLLNVPPKVASQYQKEILPPQLQNPNIPKNTQVAEAPVNYQTNRGNINSPLINNNSAQTNVVRNMPIQNDVRSTMGNIIPDNSNRPPVVPPEYRTSNTRPPEPPPLDTIKVVSGQAPDTRGKIQKFKEDASSLYREMFDNDNSGKKIDKALGNKAGKEGSIHMSMINAKKSNSTVAYIVNEAAVDMNFNKIGGSLADIAKGVANNPQKLQDFNKYKLLLDNVDRAKRGKNILPNFTSDESRIAAKRLEQQYPDFKNMGEDMNKYYKNINDKWLVDSGLVSRSEMDNLQSLDPNHVSAKKAFDELEKGMNGFGNNGLMGSSNTIQKATGNSVRDNVDIFENTIGLTDSIIKAARNNETKKILYDTILVDTNKASKWGKILPDNYEGRLDLDNIVPLKIDGKTKYIQIMDKELLQTMQGAFNVPPGSKGWNKAMTGFKGLITTYNPLFSVGNLPKDIASGYVFSTTTNNPYVYLRDLKNAPMKMKNNDKTWQLYKASVGNESNIVNTRETTAYLNNMINPSSGVKSTIGKGIDKIGKFNNTIENLNRYAEFDRTIRMGGTVQEALFNAGEVTVNFARGGKTTKFWDKGVPYLNPAMQGVDRTARAIKSKPVVTISKMLVVSALPATALYLLTNRNDPNYEDLSNRTKDTFLNIPIGDGKFFKISKARELAMLGSLLERVYRYAENKPDAFKGFGSTVKTNVLPPSPLTGSIVAPWINLSRNKDFADRTIVPNYMIQDARSKKEQHDEKTSKLAIAFGNLTGLSPIQTEYLIKSYAGVLGTLMSPSNIKNKFIADSVYSNQNTTDFYDNKYLTNQVATEKNINENIPSSKLTNEERKKNAFVTAAKYMNFLRKQSEGSTDEEKREVQKKINNMAKTMNQALENNSNMEVTLGRIKPPKYK